MLSIKRKKTRDLARCLQQLESSNSKQVVSSLLRRPSNSSLGKKTNMQVADLPTLKNPDESKKPEAKQMLQKNLNSKTLTIGYKLGDGTSGKVFLAHHDSNPKPYALKQVKLKIHKVIFAKESKKQALLIANEAVPD